MIKIVNTDRAGNVRAELPLTNKFGLPTGMLLGLVVLELGFDCLVGFIAYRHFKKKNELSA